VHRFAASFGQGIGIGLGLGLGPGPGLGLGLGPGDGRYARPQAVEEQPEVAVDVDARARDAGERTGEQGHREHQVAAGDIGPHLAGPLGTGHQRVDGVLQPAALDFKMVNRA
jgi:hypothetical protein